MTLVTVAADLRARCVVQLYDEWLGHYVLRRLFMGAWIDVRPLSRDEALTYRTAPDEALELKWNQESVRCVIGNI